MKTRSRRSRSHDDPIREATVDALNQILEPLIEFMLDAGITVHEFNQLVRDRAVRVAMKRLTESDGKESKARAAIMTGLPRSEVAKILKSPESTVRIQSDQLPARRILAAWNDDPRFSDANGNPAVLPIFGKTISFEKLVGKYGAGVPVRAMLDELTQIQAVERLDDQRIKVRVRVPIQTGLTPQAIAAVGQRSRDLLQTLAHNRRQPAQPLFESTAISDESDSELISFIRREITAQGVNFINGATSLLNRSEIKRSAKNAAGPRKCRVGVTIYYFEEKLNFTAANFLKTRKNKRKNLRRQKTKNTLFQTDSKQGFYAKEK